MQKIFYLSHIKRCRLTVVNGNREDCDIVKFTALEKTVPLPQTYRRLIVVNGTRKDKIKLL